MGTVEQRGPPVTQTYDPKWVLAANVSRAGAGELNSKDDDTGVTGPEAHLATLVASTGQRSDLASTNTSRRQVKADSTSCGG